MRMSTTMWPVRNNQNSSWPHWLGNEKHAVNVQTFKCVSSTHTSLCPCCRRLIKFHIHKARAMWDIIAFHLVCVGTCVITSSYNKTNKAYHKATRVRNTTVSLVHQCVNATPCTEMLSQSMYNFVMQTYVCQVLWYSQRALHRLWQDEPAKPTRSNCRAAVEAWHLHDYHPLFLFVFTHACALRSKGRAFHSVCVCDLERLVTDVTPEAGSNTYVTRRIKEDPLCLCKVSGTESYHAKLFV